MLGRLVGPLPSLVRADGTRPDALPEWVTVWRCSVLQPRGHQNYWNSSWQYSSVLANTWKWQLECASRIKSYCRGIGVSYPHPYTTPCDCRPALPSLLSCGTNIMSSFLVKSAEYHYISSCYWVVLWYLKPRVGSGFIGKTARLVADSDDNRLLLGHGNDDKKARIQRLCSPGTPGAEAPGLQWRRIQKSRKRLLFSDKVLFSILLTEVGRIRNYRSKTLRSQFWWRTTWSLVFVTSSECQECSDSGSERQELFLTLRGSSEDVTKIKLVLHEHLECNIVERKLQTLPSCV